MASQTQPLSTMALTMNDILKDFPDEIDSDEEFDAVKESFAQLLPKYGNLWRSMMQSAAANGNNDDRRVSRSPLREQKNHNKGGCQSPCCLVTFVPPQFLTHNNKDDDNSNDSDSRFDSDEESHTDESESSSGSTVIRFDHISFEETSKVTEEISQYGSAKASIQKESSDDDSDMEALATTLRSTAIISSPRKRSRVFIGKEVIDLISSSSESEDEDLKLPSAPGRTSTITGNRQRKLVISDASTLSSDEESWSGNDLSAAQEENVLTEESEGEEEDALTEESESEMDSVVSKDYATNTRPVKAMSLSEFKGRREELTRAVFQEFDQVAFGGKLTEHKVTVAWSKRLNTTAGKTLLTKTAGGIYKAKIELSVKVLDRLPRLRATLLHEMCHAAAFVIDHVSRPPHGQCFKKWANRAMRAVNVEVTTTHDYNIEYKYAWRCSTRGCVAKFARHSRSIDVNRQVCGKCKGTLVEVEPSSLNQADIVPRKVAKPSAYNLFVQSESQNIRQDLERRWSGNVPQAEVMKECARRWKERKNTPKVVSA